MFLCYGFYFIAIMAHIVPHATDLGIPATSAANILAIIGGASIAGKFGLGCVSDRIGTKQVFVISYILMSASMFWLMSVTGTWMLYLFAFAFGLAYGGCASVHSPIIAVLFGMRSHGLILGVIHSAFTIGATAGPVVTGYIFDVTGSYKIAFWVFAVLSIVALILILLLKPTRNESGWR